MKISPKIFLYVTNRFVRSILSGILLHCTTATWLHQNRQAEVNATLIFEKIGKFIFLISKWNTMLPNCYSIFEQMCKQNLMYGNHGREIIEEVERRSKLHDEPNARVLRRQKFSQVSSRAFVYSIPKNCNVATGFSCPGSAILLYHEILTDSRGMLGFQGRG